MKRSLFCLNVFLLGFLLSGCFETNFNFKTIVHHDGTIERETKIDGRGADRFLAPSGPEWDVKTSETKGGQTILQDTHHHIYAKGKFKNAEEIGSDFQYNVGLLIENLTDETRKEFIDELGIKEPFEKDIYARNQITVSRKRSFWATDYEYKETFQNRWLIPILLHDLKKEIVRKESVSMTSSSEVSMEETSESVAAAAATVTPEKVEGLAYKRLKEEILPYIRFHSELALPGKLVSTNAQVTRANLVVWDFTAAQFDQNYSRYELVAKSRAVNWGLILAIVIVGSVIIAAVVLGALTSSSKRKKR